MPHSESPKLHYSCHIFSTVATIMRASPNPRNDTPQERTVPWSNHWLSTFNLGWQKRIRAVMQNLNHQSCIDSWVKYTTPYLSVQPTPAQRQRQRQRTRHRGRFCSLPNASIPQTPAQWNRQRHGAYSGCLPQRQRPAYASAVESPASWSLFWLTILLEAQIDQNLKLMSYDIFDGLTDSAPKKAQLFTSGVSASRLHVFRLPRGSRKD